MSNLPFSIILAVILFRPFISTNTFPNLDLTLNLLLVVSSGLYFIKKKPHHKPTSIDKLTAVFIFSILGSSLLTPNVSNNFYHVYQYLSLILLFYISTIAAPKEKKAIIKTILISSFFLFIYSIHGFFTVSDYLASKLQKTGNPDSFALSFINQNRAFYPFISPNLLGIYSVFIFNICLSKITKSIKNSRAFFKIPLYLLSLLSLYILFLSKSLTSFLALIITIIVFFIYIRKLNRIPLYIIFSVIIAFIIVFAIRTQTQAEHLSPFYSLQQRLQYWQETIGIIIKNPLIGVGASNFSVRDSLLSHNSYLQIWAEFGIFGFLSFIGMVSMFLKRSYEKIKQSQYLYMNAGLAICGLAFLIDNLGSFSFFIPQTAFLWWIILGFVNSTKTN